MEWNPERVQGLLDQARRAADRSRMLVRHCEEIRAEMLRREAFWNAWRASSVKYSLAVIRPTAGVHREPA
jgi:hypothetical protein